MTVARAFTNTFAGIAPASVAGFVASQVVGAALGAGAAAVLFPHFSPAASPDPSDQQGAL